MQLPAGLFVYAEQGHFSTLWGNPHIQRRPGNHLPADGEDWEWDWVHGPGANAGARRPRTASDAELSADSHFLQPLFPHRDLSETHGAGNVCRWRRQHLPSAGLLLPPIQLLLELLACHLQQVSSPSCLAHLGEDKTTKGAAHKQRGLVCPCQAPPQLGLNPNLGSQERTRLAGHFWTEPPAQHNFISLCSSSLGTSVILGRSPWSPSCCPRDWKTSANPSQVEHIYFRKGLGWSHVSQGSHGPQHFVTKWKLVQIHL